MVPNEEYAEEGPEQIEEVEQSAEEEASEEGQEQEQGEQPRKSGGDPRMARLRIVERENKVLQNRFNDLINRLTPAEQEEEEPEIEVPDFEANPLASIDARQRRIETKLEKKEREEKEKEVREANRTLITMANEAIKDFMEETPDYADAINHLAVLDYEEEMDENPDLPAEEVDRRMTEKLQARKIAWIRAGKDPGEELYKRAVRRGYNPNAQKQGRVAASDAKEQIASEKKRAAAGASIARAAGTASAGKITASSIARMTDAEYRDYADRLQKEKGSGLKMKDLMPDKIKVNK